MDDGALMDAPALYRRVFDGHPAAQLLVEVAGGGIVRANASAVRLYGIDEAALCRSTLFDLATEPTDGSDTSIRELLAGARVVTRSRQCMAGNERGHVELEGVRVPADDGRELLHVSVRPIDARVAAEAELRDYRQILEDVPVAFYRSTRGPEGRFLRVNPAFVRLFDADSADQLYARDIADLYVDRAERARFSDAVTENGVVHRYEIRMRTLAGRTIWTADTAYEHQDEDGNRVFDGVIEDITRRKELEQELEFQARHDALTGLANRRHLDSVLDAEVDRAERYGQPLSALMLDLDHFKAVNDRLGHAAGDEVLRAFAATLREQVRECDLPARWGGEEFLVVLPSTGLNGARTLGEKLRSATAERDFAGTVVTASAGCAEYAPGEGKDRFLGRLDDALYAAKDGGRDRIVEDGQS